MNEYLDAIIEKQSKFTIWDFPGERILERGNKSNNRYQVVDIMTRDRSFTYSEEEVMRYFQTGEWVLDEVVPVVNNNYSLI